MDTAKKTIFIKLDDDLFAEQIAPNWAISTKTIQVGKEIFLNVLSRNQKLESEVQT